MKMAINGGGFVIRLELVCEAKLDEQWSYVENKSH